jgi:hypothetical protein
MRFGLLLTTFFGLALAPAALAPAAPVPRGAGPRYFYPTRVGDRMVHARDDNYEYTTTVAKVEKADGVLHVTTNQIMADGTERLDEKMEVSSKGLRMIRNTYRRTLPHPIWPLQVTPDADATWTGKWAVFTNSGDIFEEQEYTAAGWETVEVPAGKFQAIRVERVGTLQGSKSKCTLWYALDVGCVKWKDATCGAVLKSFTRGPN